MKYQVLFSLKKECKNIQDSVVCCSHDWRLKGKATPSDWLYDEVYYAA